MATLTYAPKPARDIPSLDAISVSDFILELRKITPKRRSKLARDIATALSHDSRTFSSSAGGLGVEAGA